MSAPHTSPACARPGARRFGATRRTISTVVVTAHSALCSGARHSRHSSPTSDAFSPPDYREGGVLSSTSSMRNAPHRMGTTVVAPPGTSTGTDTVGTARNLLVTAEPQRLRLPVRPGHRGHQDGARSRQDPGRGSDGNRRRPPIDVGRRRGLGSRRRLPARARSLQRDSEPEVGRRHPARQYAVVRHDRHRHRRDDGAAPRSISTRRAALPGRDSEAAGRGRITRIAKPRRSLTARRATPLPGSRGGPHPLPARSAMHRNSASELSPLDKTLPFSSASR